MEKLSVSQNGPIQILCALFEGTPNNDYIKIPQFLYSQKSKLMKNNNTYQNQNEVQYQRIKPFN